MNSAGVTVKNCYNYGTVASDSDNYCGAIVRHLMKDTVDLKGKLTNNYYQADSAPAGLGNGSKGTGVTAEAKDNAAFESGEVCYLINGGKAGTAADRAIWMQDVDNGKTPYDKYPVFDVTAVYHLSNGN